MTTTTDRTLELYDGVTGSGGYDSRKVPMDPSRCSIKRIENMGRAGIYVDQCPRKVKPGATAPVWDFRTSTAAVLPVCGVHLGVYKRAVKKEREEQAKRDAYREGMDEMDSVAKEIRELTGLSAEADYLLDPKLFRRRATGRVVLDGKALLDYLTKEAR